MIDWNKYRKEFPHLANQIYLNHAAISPQNLRAKAAVKAFWEERLMKNIEYWPDAMHQKESLVKKIGQLVHAPAENIALIPNPFLNLRRKGVEIDFVHHRNGKILLEDIEKSIHPKTRVLSISFVEFLNGYRNDLKAIAQMCHERGIIFSVDAIQGLGALKMDVEAMEIDFLSTGGHKWLMWPAGLGFIYISPRIFDRIFPAQAGWLSVKTPWNFFDYDQDFAPDAHRFETGTFNTGTIVAANATLDMMLEIGPENIEQKILENTNFLIKQLSAAGFELFTDMHPKHWSGIVSFRHQDAEGLFHFLKEKRITVSLREGMIRISPHFYNNLDDLVYLLEMLNNYNFSN